MPPFLMEVFSPRISDEKLLMHLHSHNEILLEREASSLCYLCLS